MELTIPIESGSDLSKEELQFEALILGLITNQYAILDDFISAETLAGLRTNLKTLNENDALHAAGFGNKSVYQLNKSIRSDNIKWINNDSENIFEREILDKLENFKNYLNVSCFTSLKSFETHYASYEPKSFYKRHLDQFQTDNGRKFSMVIYLNENWKPEDCGHIRLYPDDAAPIELLPLGGRVVFFKSDILEHEVKPSFTRERLSIAAWFKA